jgi:Domain of unknown function (DUF1707)
MGGLSQVLIATIYVVFWLVAASTTIAFPIWLGVKVVGAVRRRGAARPWVRIGDRERAAVAARLGDDYAAGRLALGELESRTAATWDARTYGQLAGVLADLPGRRPRRLAIADVYDACVGVGMLALATAPVTRLVGGALVLGLLLSHADPRRGEPTVVVVLTFVTALASTVSPVAGLLVAGSVAIHALRLR